MSWVDDVMPWLNRVMKLKAVMLKKGLIQARAKCLCDGGEIRAALAPGNNHIRAACDKCGQRVME